MEPIHISQAIDQWFGSLAQTHTDDEKEEETWTRPYPGIPLRRRAGTHDCPGHRGIEGVHGGLRQRSLAVAPGHRHHPILPTPNTGREMNAHVRCRCLGRSFGYEEWSAYLKTNPPAEVYEHGGFRYNIHDVCLNPRTAAEVAGKDAGVAVTVSLSPSGWTYGYHVWSRNGSASSPCRFTDGSSVPCFDSMESAVRNCADRLITNGLIKEPTATLLKQKAVNMIEQR